MARRGRTKKPSQEPAAEREPSASEDAEERPSAAGEEGAEEPPAENGPAAELEARCAELEARWLRAQADYQNLRRRSAADVEAALQRELQPLLQELLLVLDYLDLALASPLESEDARNLATGVEMTRAKLVQALETAGVAPVATDQGFDPAVHDAAETRLEQDRRPGTILETVRKGYTWRGKVLRPARVVVASGGEGGERDEPAPRREGDGEDGSAAETAPPA